MTPLVNRARLAFMRSVGVTELKNRLSYYLRLVRRGETIEVRDRSIPAAILTGLPVERAASPGLLDRLERDGIITAFRGKPYTDFLRRPAPVCRADAVQALVDERGDR